MNQPPFSSIIRLVKCGKRSCGYVLAESERQWIDHPELESATMAVCPLCRCSSFYALRNDGKEITVRDSRAGITNEFEAATIEPSARLGAKMKRLLLAAKARALAASQTPSTKN